MNDQTQDTAQPQTQTDPQNVQPQPGSLNFSPKGPEAVAEITSSAVEKAPAPQEKLQPQENEPLYDDATQPQTDTQPTQTNAKPQPTPKPSRIVDKSHEAMRLHHLDHPQDKLTAEADKEEEEFIAEVETAHEHK